MLFNLPIRIGGGRGDTNEHVLDQLSAYIDYELSDTERERVREHLRRCPVCENELATLKAAKQLLNELPLHPVPRTFILTPDMVGRGVTGPVERRRPLGWTLAGRLRTATALVAVLLVLVLSGDVLSRGVLGGSRGAVPSFIAQTTPNGLLPPQARRVANPTTVALAEATTTTVAAFGGGGGLGAGPGEAPVPPAAPTVAAAAPSDSANQTTSAAPVPTGATQEYAATPEATTSGVAADQAQPPSAHTLTQPAEVAPAGATPQVSGWQLLEGGLLLLLVVLGAGALWARGRGV